jgi:xanthine dehydrogenase small subunit
MADGIRFLLDGKRVELGQVDPTTSALDLLRGPLRRTGSKEGCAEGDCGACTIVLGERDPAGLTQWRAVNACILFAPMLDGKAVLTVESLARHGSPHPVQHELVQRHGSQCGFCTPGFVMSLYARSIGALGTRDAAVADVLSGNLCRCTGYGPILAAGEAVACGSSAAEQVGPALAALQREHDLAYTWNDPHSGQQRQALVPRSSAALADLLLQHPHAHLVAGATDVGLWVSKQLRNLQTLIFVGDIAELRQIEENADGLSLGAAVRYAEAHAALARLHPDLGELVRRIAGTQVRNAGTVGGNIANGSPIGDTPPALVVLGAQLTLRRGDRRRTLALEDFFIAYGKQDRQPGEFVESIFIPRPPGNARLCVRKLSKRFDSDISAVCGAALVQVDDGIVSAARIAFGGMAGTPARARHAETALIGRPWGEAAVEAAAAALAQDYQPLDDVRGSAQYRLLAAGNLLRGLWLREVLPAQPLSVRELVDG